LPSGEILAGEPEPDPLRLGFMVSGIGDGGSGVPDRSLIVRSIVHQASDSTAGDPPPSVAGVLLGLATVNGVMPSGGLAKHPRSTYDVGV
jgi:hypothetical protein